MKPPPPFDDRWNRAAGVAREAASAPAAALPAFFTSRVLARWRETPAEPWEDILALFGGRAIIAAAAACLAAAAFAYYDAFDSRIARPALEQTVSMEVWVP